MTTYKSLPVVAKLKSKFNDSWMIGLKGVEGLIEAKPGGPDVSEVAKGDTVSVVISKNKRGYWVLDKIRVEEEAKPQGAAPAWGGSAGSGGGYNDPARNASIIVQHSQTAATDLLKFLVESEAVKLPAAGKRKDFILAEYDRLVTKLARQANGATALELLSASQPEATDEDAADDLGDEPTDKSEDTPETEGDAEFDDDFDKV